MLILCGDVPLIQSETIIGLVEDHQKASRDISLLAGELENPFGYGRVLIRDNGQLSGIIEETDASTQQKQVKLINSGIYCVNKKFLAHALPEIGSDNAQGELYLTDIIAIGYRENRKMGVLIGTDSQQILGVNTCQDLEAVDAIMAKRLRIIP